MWRLKCTIRHCYSFEAKILVTVKVMKHSQMHGIHIYPVQKWGIWRPRLRFI